MGHDHPQPHISSYVPSLPNYGLSPITASVFPFSINFQDTSSDSMASNSMPTIVLVPGAWHKVAQYAPLTTRLEQAGYEVVVVDYPSTGPNPTNKNFDPDVKIIHESIAQLADQGKGILVVVHSAGGIVAGEAAKGLGKADRTKDGLAGGIVRMVYICAFAATEGVSLYDATGGPDPWHIIEGGTVRSSQEKDIFYNKCSPEVAEEQIAKLELFAKGTFESRPTYAAWKHIPCTYLVCENDHAIPLVAQEAMIAQEGANFDVVRCSADHSPFLCMPDFTAEVVRRAAGEEI